jgi:para-aminobenzoate synthetase/4-amino-4-deoxychorismate lyase
MGDAPFVLLDNAQPAEARLHLFAEPVNVLTAHDISEAAAALAELDASLARGFYAAGWLGYELGYALESRLGALLPRDMREPLLWLGIFRRRTEILTCDIEAWFDAHVTGRAYAGPLRFEESEASYRDAFHRAQSYIRAGDIYQVNHTFQGRFPFLGDPLALYRRLRGFASAPHAGFVWDGTRHVLSLSPELFFSVRNGVLTARPMKGTQRRGRNAAEDEALKAHLAASEKDRAENLMIVDLIRNDLGRVAETGSVRVDGLYAIETYPTVHQMVSTVRANLRAEAAAADIIRALFPCGSVTGTPKIRAQEIIRELERSPRGVYCGAVGSFAPDGDAHFNVAIRTITITGNEGALGVGGAIVADSTAPGEYEEALLKSRWFTDAREPIALIETLRHDPAEGFVRGDLHLDRLEASARALAIPMTRKHVLSEMRRAVAGRDGPSRVRVLLHESGEIDVTVTPFTPVERWTCAVSEQRMQSGDLLARHKTAWRALFDDELTRLSARTGCDQVLFLNERGELVESSGANIFVRKHGTLVTPPLSSGALAGTLRRALLESGDCVEGVLYPADLAGNDVFLGNSLRGLVPATPAHPSDRHGRA